MKFKHVLTRESSDPDSVAALTHEAITSHGFEKSERSALHDAHYHVRPHDIDSDELHHHLGVHDTLKSLGWNLNRHEDHTTEIFHHYTHPVGNHIFVQQSYHEADLHHDGVDDEDYIEPTLHSIHIRMTHQKI